MKTKFLVLSLIMLAISVGQLSFKTNRSIDQVRSLALRWSEEMLEATEQLERRALQLKSGEVTIDEFRRQVSETRKAYKKHEFLLEYFYPITIKSQINGAPLPHLDPYFPRPVVHEPNGLQTIDELAYSEDALTQVDDLYQLSHSVHLHYANLHRDFKAHPFLDREVFEAGRLQLIRIFTLGSSGFDTPGSLNGIDESHTALSSLKQCFSAYTIELNQENRQLGRNLMKLLDEAVIYTADNPDFESFDRLIFLKKYIDPIYGALLDLQLALNIETIYETTTLKQSVNYFAKSIFDPHFLNPYFYTHFAEGSDSPELRRLGEELFYERRLSADGRGSCSSCHQPQKGFSDGLPKSNALNGEGQLDRNAPGLLNAAYSKRFFHDMRALKLEDQVEHVVINEKEFHTSFPVVFETLQGDSVYLNLFKKAFPDFSESQLINKTTVSQALASYMISLKSFNSTFDQFVRGETDRISPSVHRGFNLFMGKAACGTCHFAPTFAGLAPPLYQDSESEVLGVLQDPKSSEPKIDADRGRGVNKNPMEKVWFYDMSFKTPTVRNVGFTGPYFHNGAYESLEEVVDFYDHGGGAGLGLQLPHQTLSSDSLHLSSNEKADLIAFLNSLSDNPYTEGNRE